MNAEAVYWNRVDLRSLAKGLREGSVGIKPADDLDRGDTPDTPKASGNDWFIQLSHLPPSGCGMPQLDLNDGYEALSDIEEKTVWLAPQVRRITWGSVPKPWRGNVLVRVKSAQVLLDLDLIPFPFSLPSFAPPGSVYKRGISG